MPTALKKLKCEVCDLHDGVQSYCFAEETRELEIVDGRFRRYFIARSENSLLAAGIIENDTGIESLIAWITGIAKDLPMNGLITCE